MLRFTDAAYATAESGETRTTIAHGSVLEARTRLPTEDPFRGVHSPSLMIGSGIVDAYRLERQTAGGLMSVDDRLWATRYDDALQKLQLEVAIWRLSFIEYTTRRTAIETIKHFGAMHRHLNELFQGLKGHVKLKAWDLGQLEMAIASERSRLGR